MSRGTYSSSNIQVTYRVFKIFRNFYLPNTKLKIEHRNPDPDSGVNSILRPTHRVLLRERSSERAAVTLLHHRRQPQPGGNAICTGRPASFSMPWQPHRRSYAKKKGSSCMNVTTMIDLFVTCESPREF